MEKAYRHLVKWALQNGYRVDVDYEGHGEPDDVFENCTFQQAIDEIHAVENPVVILRDPESGKSKGWASIIWGYGMQPEETIADYSVTPALQEWERSYPGYK